MDDKIKKSVTEKFKEGVSVQELEKFARKYTTETFIIISVIIATISSTFHFFNGAGWSIVLGGIGAILSIALPAQIHQIEKLYFSFVTKQEQTAQIAIGIVQIVIALFVPFVIFAQLGMLAGLSFHHFSRQPKTVEEKERKKSKTENEEEHI
jgi:hypothetical protein